jgi:hypothetical protein
MTDIAPAEAKASEPVNSEDAKLEQFGYTQKLDRSVGRLASFALGFATISATTAVFTGFGAGYFTAGGPFVWTLLLAAAVFLIWTFIAADLCAKIPLAGYAYQWTSRIHGSVMAFFTGVLALAGWVCGMTGVGFILSGYLGSLFGWNMSQSAQILVAIGVMAVCMLVNLYGVRFATMVNNIGVSLELVVTVGATLLVAIVAFSSPANHQPISVLFTGGTADQHSAYILAWLAASLGPFFGLIGVEASADIAEETVNARKVIPRTMFYALTASIVIEFLMYVVYVLAIKDAGAVEAASAAPIEEIITQQVGPGRRTDRRRRGVDQRDGVHPCQHPGGHPAHLLDGPRQHAAVLPRMAARVPVQPDAHLRGARSVRPVDHSAAVGADQRKGVLPHHRSVIAGGMRDVLPADGGRAGRQPPRHHSRAGARHVRSGPGPRACRRRRPHRVLPGLRRTDPPAAIRQQRLRVRRPRAARRHLGNDRATQAARQR